MTIIDSPVALWNHLCSSAGLELRLKGGLPGRDADVEDALKSALAAPATAPSLEAWLMEDAASLPRTVTTERLLIAALNSQGGFGRMMQDILDLLVTAEARQASHGLSVEFKFDTASDPIKATLEEFREVVNHTQAVLEKRPKLPDAHRMGVLSNTLGSFVASSFGDAPQNFPPVEPLNPTGASEVDTHLDTIVQLVSAFRALCENHGSTRQQVFDAAQDLEHRDPDATELCRQLFAASNNWDVLVLAGAQQLATEVHSGKLSSKEASLKLSEALSGIEWGETWVKQTIQQLLDVLKLPTWRRRHELYSVWVGTRLLKVAGQVDADMQFHPVDGVLSFEFGGSRLATFSWQNKQYDVWAELRSALVGKSAKRKKGIQPDFRILQASISKSPNAQTSYVLECKHYLNASVSNFSQAAAATGSIESSLAQYDPRRLVPRSAAAHAGACRA